MLRSPCCFSFQETVWPPESGSQKKEKVSKSFLSNWKSEIAILDWSEAFVEAERERQHQPEGYWPGNAINLAWLLYTGAVSHDKKYWIKCRSAHAGLLSVKLRSSCCTEARSIFIQHDTVLVTQRCLFACVTVQSFTVYTAYLISDVKAALITFSFVCFFLFFLFFYE